MICRLLIHLCSLHFTNGLNKTITIFVFTMQKCFHSTTARINAIIYTYLCLIIQKPMLALTGVVLVCGVAFCILGKVSPIEKTMGHASSVPPHPQSQHSKQQSFSWHLVYFLTYDSTELCIRFILMCVQGARELRTQFVYNVCQVK